VGGKGPSLVEKPREEKDCEGGGRGGPRTIRGPGGIFTTGSFRPLDENLVRGRWLGKIEGPGRGAGAEDELRPVYPPGRKPMEPVVD